MKKITTLLLVSILVIAINNTSMAKSNLKEVTIKTNAQCGECKERIEKALHKVSGVKKVDLDLDKELITVKYKADKTDETSLRKTVAGVGYDADDIKAEPAAVAKLPKCCRAPSTTK